MVLTSIKLSSRLGMLIGLTIGCMILTRLVSNPKALVTNGVICSEADEYFVALRGVTRGDFPAAISAHQRSIFVITLSQFHIVKPEKSLY